MLRLVKFYVPLEQQEEMGPARRLRWAHGGGNEVPCMTRHCLYTLPQGQGPWLRITVVRWPRPASGGR